MTSTPGAPASLVCPLSSSPDSTNPSASDEYVAELLDTGEAEVLSRMLKGIAEGR